MWIFTRHGFLSAVKNLNARGPQDALLVRSRSKEDLSRLARFITGKTKGRYVPRVMRTRRADYLYRMTCSRAMLAAFLEAQVAQLDYPNFKNEIAKTDAPRARAYADVWAVLLNYFDPLPVFKEFFDERVVRAFRWKRAS